jgi:Ca-activated chloride channel family protein
LVILRLGFILAFLAVFAMSGAQAPNPAEANQQSKPPAADSTFRLNVNEVIVPVTVTDEKGHFVSNLEKKDFQIFEENKLQQIRTFAHDRNQPVVIGFLLDLSTSSRTHWESFQNAATELIQHLLTGNVNYAGYLVDYAQDAEVSVNTTSDPDELVDKVAKLKPGGGAALYDAIFLACTSRKLMPGEPIEPRRILIIMGDGHDNASGHSLAQAVQLAQRNLVTIYGISTQAFGFTNQGDDTLQKLALETGGRVVYPLGDVYRDTDGYLARPSDDGNYAMPVGAGAYADVVDAKLSKGVADIVGEVTSQYLLFYVSDNPKDKTYRNLRVTVDLPNVKVRTRKGYYASAAGQVR